MDSIIIGIISAFALLVFSLIASGSRSTNSTNSTNSNVSVKKENYPEGFHLTHRCHDFCADVNSDCLLIKSQQTGNWIKYKISDIIDVEIVVDNNIVQKFSVTRAITGGVLFGAVGGAIGGFSGKQERCKSMVLCIHFQNGRVFRFNLMMPGVSVKTTSFSYQLSSQIGQNYIEFLNRIINIVDRKNNK